MKILMIAAAATVLGLTAAAFATGPGSANAERQAKPTPNRGGIAGGPAHDMIDGGAAVQNGARDQRGHDRTRSGKGSAPGR